MCGIVFCLKYVANTSSNDAGTKFGSDEEDNFSLLTEHVKPRGPDDFNELCLEVLSKEDRTKGQEAVELCFQLRFFGSTLHMRGSEVTQQPLVDQYGNVLLFNGEIFDGMEVDLEQNDGKVLLDNLAKVDNFLRVMNTVEGPYAMVYYQAEKRILYYGRDSLGRRSLLVHKPTMQEPFLMLSSSIPDLGTRAEGWEEVLCDRIFHLDLNIPGFCLPNSLPCQPIISCTKRVPKCMAGSQHRLFYPFSRLSTAIPTSNDIVAISSTLELPQVTDTIKSLISKFERVLEDSLSRRILNLPQFAMDENRLHRGPLDPKPAPIAVLFSGGIDCSVLTLLADRILPSGETIDLINVAFENPRKVNEASRTVKASAKSIKKKGRRKGENFHASKAEEEENLPSGLESVKLETSPCDLPEFEGKEKDMIATLESPSLYEVPDRLTGRETYRELKKIRPNRTWRFIEVDVTYEEMLEHRPKVIELMYPNRTIMDLSIAIAFYFAARGRGFYKEDVQDSESVPYTSTARVLLSGLGADELLGGYARHRRAFYQYDASEKKGNWSSLISELQMDLDRIPYRNLGRDDRIISYHGKEARYPFLAGKVVEFCCNLPIWLKTDPRFEAGVGDKLLLRLLARHLGLTGAASLKKRAIHFGARTAKMELDSGRDKGTTLIS